MARPASRLCAPALASAVAVASLAACGGDATLSGSEPAPTGPPATAGSSTPAPTEDLVLAIASGPWRQRPVEAGPAFRQPFEDGCRAAEPAIAALSVAVVDIRGGGLVTVVFGDTTSGFVCWSALEAPATPLEVRSLGVVPAAADGIDAILYDHDRVGGASRVVAIGRVGPLSEPRPVLGDQNPARVIAQLGGEEFIWAAFGGGWYSLWWPGVEPTGGIAVTNGRNEVLVSVEPAFP
jgi:hypothetical protein